MNKTIIFSLHILLPASSHSMQYNKHDAKLLQTTKDRYNVTNIDKKKNFSRALKLLDKKKANPDFRESLEDPTSLMIAVYHNDYDYAHLFLTYGADPEKRALYPGRTQEVPINVFEMSNSTSWFQEMVRELTT